MRSRNQTYVSALVLVLASVFTTSFSQISKAEGKGEDEKPDASKMQDDDKISRVKEGDKVPSLKKGLRFGDRGSSKYRLIPEKSHGSIKIYENGEGLSVKIDHKKGELSSRDGRIVLDAINRIKSEEQEKSQLTIKTSDPAAGVFLARYAQRRFAQVDFVRQGETVKAVIMRENLAKEFMIHCLGSSFGDYNRYDFNYKVPLLRLKEFERYFSQITAPPQPPQPSIL